MSTHLTKDYRNISQKELHEEILVSFRKFDGQRGIISVTKALVKQLHINKFDLGPKREPYRDTFTEIVAKGIADLEKAGALVKHGNTEWRFNKCFIEPAAIIQQVDRTVIADAELTAIGKVQKLVMSVFEDFQGELQMEKDFLKEAVTAKLPNDIAASAINNALSKLGIRKGEGYLDLSSIQGIIVLTAKGAEAVKTGNYKFESKLKVSPRQIEEQCPRLEIQVAILYVLAVSKSRSLSALEIAKACALFWFTEVNQVVSENSNSETRFQKYVYARIYELRKLLLIEQPFGTRDCISILKAGWLKLQKDKNELEILGLELPTQEPIALTPIVREPEPKLEPARIAELEAILPRFHNGSNGHTLEEATCEAKSDFLSLEPCSSEYCFWCHSLLELSNNGFYVTVERTVTDNAGCHIEITPFCLSCSLSARELLAKPELKHIELVEL